MHSEASNNLGMALVMSSSTPLLLLDEQLLVKAASGSFCRDFSIDCSDVVGKELFALGEGEWNIPQLRSLLTATAGGSAAIDAYEIDFQLVGEPALRLVINAHVLDRHQDDVLHIVVAVTDVTEARRDRRNNDALVEEKRMLMQELNHRVANSLQIIASVLMQRVRTAQSEETRTYLRDAHNRVMSIATLQHQLASTATGEVALRSYFTALCSSIGASMIANPDMLTLTVDADDSGTTADKSVTMGLIVTELVINSLKHAYIDPDARGTIKVGFHTIGDGWKLTVADDGIGIQGDHKSGKPGLGTGIVNALAGQLSARVEVTDANPGCLVTITHP